MHDNAARNRSRVAFCGVLLAACLSLGAAANGWSADEWRGLVVALEHRCAPYDPGDYPYPQAVELRIIAGMEGRIYGPYTGRYFSSRRKTDIEHIVARSEAHDSGLCRANSATRRAFARDLLNLTLAAPAVNRCGARGKCAYDAAAWLPPMNRCWFARRILNVRRKYRLTIDRREAAALERVLSGCNSTEMVFAKRASAPDPPPRVRRSPSREALRRWDDNRNGRITCKEARRHGIAPVRRGHPAYPFMHDRDGDGIVCE